MNDYDFTEPQHRYMLARRICLLPMEAFVEILPGLITTKIIPMSLSMQAMFWLASKFKGISVIDMLRIENATLIAEHGMEKLDVRIRVARNITAGYVSRKRMEIALDLVRAAEAWYYGNDTNQNP